jgi:hypothetical protein
MTVSAACIKTAVNDRMIVNDELDRFCTEAVAVYFRALGQHFLGGTEEKRMNPK